MFKENQIQVSFTDLELIRVISVESSVYQEEVFPHFPSEEINFYRLIGTNYIFIKLSSEILANQKVCVLSFFASSNSPISPIEIRNASHLTTFLNDTPRSLFLAFQNCEIITYVSPKQETTDSLYSFQIDLTNSINHRNGDDLILAISLTSNQNVDFIDNCFLQTLNIDSDAYVSFLSCSSLDNNYISLESGEAIHSFDLIKTLGSKMPISLSLHYSQLNRINSIPQILKNNFDYNVVFENHCYILTDYLGQRTSYSLLDNDNPIYVEFYRTHDESCNNLYFCIENQTYLVVDSLTHRLRLYLSNENIYEFAPTYNNTDYRLSRIFNNLNETINFIWTRTGSTYLLTRISNSSGDVVNLSYSSLQLDSVSYSQGNESVSLTYTSTSLTIEKYSGSTLTYRYILSFNSSNLLTSVDYRRPDESNGTIRRISYTYDSDNRVITTSLHNYCNNLLDSKDISYSDYQTKITSFDGHFIIYSFDDLGRIVNISNDQKIYQTANYGEENSSNINLITNQATVITPSKNYLLNGGFEDDLSSWNINTPSYISIVDNPILSGKALHIHASSSSLILSQSVTDFNEGNYRLKFKSKSNLNNGVTLVLTYTCKRFTTTIPFRLVDFSITRTINVNKTSHFDSFYTEPIEVLLGDNDKAFSISISSTGNSEAYIDEIELIKVEDDSCFDYVDNGDFSITNISSFPEGYCDINLGSNDIVEVLPIEEANSLPSPYAFHFTSSLDGEIRRLGKTVNFLGKKGEAISLVVFAKALLDSNNPLNLNVTIHYESGDKTHSFNFANYISTWQILCRTIVLEGDCSSIFIDISYFDLGLEEAYINRICLYKGAVTSSYNYDKEGNITDSFTNGSSTYINRTGNRLDSVITKDGSLYRYQYDSNKRLTSISDSYNNKITYSYQPNSNNVSEAKLTSGNLELINSYSYDNNDNLITSIDEYNNETNYSYDSYKRVSSVIYSSYYKEQYAYNVYNQITKVSRYNYPYQTESDFENNLTYNNVFQSLTNVNNDNTSFSYSYDNDDRLLSISSNNELIESFTYNKLINNINTNLVTSIAYGTSGEVYSFSYDDYSRLIEVSLNNSPIYKYEYNKMSLVTRIKDLTNNEATYYDYDPLGHPIYNKTNDQVIRYRYDNLNNIQTKHIANNGTSKDYFYQYSYENNYTRERFLLNLSRNYFDELIIPMYEGKGLNGLRAFDKHLTIYHDSSIDSDTFSFINTDTYVEYYFSLINSNIFSGVTGSKIFDLDNWRNDFRNQKSFYIFFKPEMAFTRKTNILSFRDDTPNHVIRYAIEITSIDTLSLTDSVNEVAILNGSLIFDSYNLLYISISGSRMTMRLNNGEPLTQLISLDASNIGSIILANNVPSFVPSIDSTSSGYYNRSLGMSFDIALMGISNHEYTNDELLDLQNAFHKYYETGRTPNKTNSINYFVNELNNEFNFAISNGEFDFNNGVKSHLSLTRLNNQFDDEDNSSLIYDSSLSRYVYHAKGDNSLSYNLSFNGYGTISFFFKPTLNNRNSQIISITNNGTNLLSILYNLQGRISIVSSGSSLSISLLPNTYHHFYIVFSSSTSVYVDGVLYSFALRNVQDVNIEFGKLKNRVCVFDGYFDSMAYSTLAIPYSPSLVNRLRPITISSTSNSLGLITNKDIATPSSTLSTSYSYNKYRPISEVNYLNEEFNYSYNNIGQIASVIDNDDNIESFSYDNSSRLITRSINNIVIESFTYDSNGNILTKTDGNDSYTYSYQNNRLVSIFKNNNLYRSFTYNSSNCFYPSIMTIKGNNESLSWQGKRLTNIGNNILYRYNEEGIRIYKCVNNEVTNYQVEGNLILSMDKTINNVTHHIDFHYDINNQIVSLTYNNQDYFYIRNVLGTILGIMNSSGNLITRYTYSSYGEPTITILANNGDDLFVANNNPFLFKGYYYDDETDLYYLLSRYYDPEIGSFISPDSVDYLDPTSINGLNLYAYCGGDPVNYCDPYGCFAISLFLLTVLSALAKTISGVVTQTAASVISYIGMSIASIFNTDVRKDLCSISWNPFNSDESKVFESSFVSFYKGIPVFRIEGFNGRSGTFLGIFLNHDNSDKDTLKHEFGHIPQQLILGPFGFASTVFICSSAQLSARSYYDRPWEITADIMGGVGRDYNAADVKRGWRYLALSHAFGLFSYLLLIGEYKI